LGKKNLFGVSLPFGFVDKIITFESADL